jgi:hypothetical protein
LHTANINWRAVMPGRMNRAILRTEDEIRLDLAGQLKDILERYEEWTKCP